MNWFVNTLGTSIGKKLMMAFTGLCFCGFLVVHLAGNLTLYGGKDFFNGYVAHLHSYGPLINVAELILLTLAIIHVLTGTFLFFGNLSARPKRYAVNKSAGGRTIGSATMPYTGFLMLIFIIFHLFNFHFADHATQTVFDIVSNAFAAGGYVTIYIISMVIVAIHVSHGFWSAFQTLGANHPKYMPLIQGLGTAFSLIVGIGFGFIPIYVFTA
ncbi:succinate dehydrogenase cytochrome b subunit [Desulfonema magnum]|uniref:Succinate dehydrogenase cytochrome b556 subunit n=1 Tax=Desulfonema magnum TaxID=45655 RepID=A0A975GN21_9BACT|nr:succinate dehydrogenase cytochrome b subunit [Desulfonema magnum]QTA87551.1 Succinate dehydrogenase cytochrome b556 subunit [Desulfonema magnum]